MRRAIRLQKFLGLLPLLLLLACTTSGDPVVEATQRGSEGDSSLALHDTIVAEPPAPPAINIDSLLGQEDSAWVDLEQILPQADFEIRYATTNNFMELQVYECPACFTRVAVARQLVKIQQTVDTMGLSLKFFDCYRPSSAQWALWKKKPDARYVHPPTQGSMHSRGNALDLTLIDKESRQELDMGTAFDYFGKEAYWNYTGHGEEVNKNRALLRKLLYENNFKTVSTEWWHFFYTPQKFKLSNMIWPCE